MEIHSKWIFSYDQWGQKIDRMKLKQWWKQGKLRHVISFVGAVVTGSKKVLPEGRMYKVEMRPPAFYCPVCGKDFAVVSSALTSNLKSFTFNKYMEHYVEHGLVQKMWARFMNNTWKLLPLKLSFGQREYEIVSLDYMKNISYDEWKSDNQYKVQKYKEGNREVIAGLAKQREEEQLKNSVV